jgi:ATP-dependent DNA helicase PIF1
LSSKLKTSQLILCGDFHQLPPVSKASAGDPPAVYAFDATVWSKVFEPRNMVCLRTVFRQKERTFSQLLNEMRKGRVSGADEARVCQLERRVAYDDGVPAVEL